MSVLSKLFGKKDNAVEISMPDFERKKAVVPEWASVMGQKEYTQFMSVVEAYFKERNEPYTIDDGIVRLGGNNWEFGLSNLLQTCAQKRAADYPAIIAHHFGTMMDMHAFSDTFSKISDDFEKIKQYVGVRLYDHEYVMVKGEDTFICRPFAGEVYAALIYDFPQSVQSLPKSDFDKWGKTEDEVFAIGIENIRQNYELNAVEVNFGEDIVFIAEAEHFFVPNILLDLERHSEFIGRGGAIVAIPTRSVAFIYPICDMKIVNVLNVFFMQIPKLYSEGPGSLTREIYWYHDGQYEPLAYESGEKISFTPSEAFLAMLNSGLE